MWAAILAIAGPVLAILAKLMGGGRDKAVDDARELGRAEQQNIDMKGGIDTVRKANDAAKKVEQEEMADDPNNLDR